jgi:hypothetical protein
VSFNQIAALADAAGANKGSRLMVFARDCFGHRRSRREALRGAA